MSKHFIISFIFFGSLQKIEIHRTDCKKLGIYFNFDCCTWFIPTIDLCYFYLNHILW